MFQVEKTRFGEFEQLVLRDTEAGTSAAVVPARGGMLTSLVRDGYEYIYIHGENFHSEERARCAVPVLFPCCGRTVEETWRWNGKEYPMGIHGFVHSCSWELAEESAKDCASVTLALSADDFTRKSYPFDFSLRLTYALRGNAVTVSLQVENSGTEPFPFTFGFHPYFCVSALKNARVEADASLIAKPSTTELRPFEGGECDLPADIALDSVLLSGVKKRAVLRDKGNGRSVTLDLDENYPYIMLWSMPERDCFICVEPWNGLPNSLNDGRYQTLAPGASHQAAFTITVD
ncbi:MAG: hypothetical protein HFG26_08500 [Provencibacterium sp.]|jgi:galactose mutarotase-like enzyme|nr:hypothetical protein [Provencibacterium sp.]